MFQSLGSPPKDIRIGIWGANGAGKTTFLTKLYQVLIDNRWSVQTDENAKDFIKRNLAKIAERTFPDRTPRIYGEPPRHVQLYSDTSNTSPQQGCFKFY